MTIDPAARPGRFFFAARLELLALVYLPSRSLALTPRQREVVALIATGASDNEIGTALGIATATAQKHVTRLLKGWTYRTVPPRRPQNGLEHCSS